MTTTNTDRIADDRRVMAREAFYLSRPALDEYIRHHDETRNPSPVTNFEGEPASWEPRAYSLDDYLAVSGTMPESVWEAYRACEME